MPTHGIQSSQRCQQIVPVPAKQTSLWGKLPSASSSYIWIVGNLIRQERTSLLLFSISRGHAYAFTGTVGSAGGKIVTGLAQGAFGRYKGSSAIQLHVLSISSAVTKLKWRPPAFSVGSSSSSSSSTEGNNIINNGDVDAHDSMLAVATARLANAGGSGVVSLWSFHRPFMPLCVVEGHEEGDVADFIWLETPDRWGSFWDGPTTNPSETAKESKRNRKSQNNQQYDDNVSIRSSGRGEIDAAAFVDNFEDGQNDPQPSGAIWQHVLTVGRDGRCIIQSLLRGKP